MTLVHARKSVAAVMAVALLLVLALPTFAVESAELDWSADLTTGLAGITAGVAASIGAVFLIAVLVRATRIAARIALKALGFVK
jgi:hypothetical protein